MAKTEKKKVETVSASKEEKVKKVKKEIEEIPTVNAEEPKKARAKCVKKPKESEIEAPKVEKAEEKPAVVVEEPKKARAKCVKKPKVTEVEAPKEEVKEEKIAEKAETPKKEKKKAKEAKIENESDMPKIEEPIVVETKKTEEVKLVNSQEIEIMSPTKKLKKIKGYSKKDLEEFKQVILQKREEIIEQIQVLKDQMMDPATGQYVNENSPYSLHMAEQGTDAQEREKLYLWAQRENKFLGYLESALLRIEDGTYGICVECIDEPQNLCPTCPLIPKERLLAVPHTQHCLPVKEKSSKK